MIVTSFLNRSQFVTCNGTGDTTYVPYRFCYLETLAQSTGDCLPAVTRETELSSTLEAIMVPQTDEKFHKDIQTQVLPVSCRQAIDMTIQI